MQQALKELFQYKNMLISFTHSEIRNRYKGSVLGVMWSLLNPLFLLIIYGFVFSFLIGGRMENYFLYLFTGLLGWVYFRGAVLNSANVIVGNAGLVKKTYFPREILPIASVLNYLINYFFGLVILIPALIVFGDGIGWTVLWLPLVILFQTIFTIGLAFLFSSLTVYLRDIRQILEVVMMAMFYYTPIIYSPDMIPAKYRWLLDLNPMKHFVVAYQDLFFYQKAPGMKELLIMFLLAGIALAIGWAIFRKLNIWFAEKI